jgi:hypothetical protein
MLDDEDIDDDDDEEEESNDKLRGTIAAKVEVFVHKHAD